MAALNQCIFEKNWIVCHQWVPKFYLSVAIHDLLDVLPTDLRLFDIKL